MNQINRHKILEAFGSGTHSPTTIAIVGGQWGDEAKGKLADLLAIWAKYVVRGTGGANAGHTILIGDQEIVLHLVPSGIHYDIGGVVNICGSGMVIDPKALLEELDALKQAGLTHNNLKIAYNANLVLPQHMVLDRVREAAAGNGKIGTTGRGIGPAYIDKVARVGMTMNALLNADTLRDGIARNLAHASQLLTAYDPALVAAITEAVTGHGHLDEGLILDEYLDHGERLGGYITDTDALLRSVLGAENILLEGAQGILLGVNEGTYPYVTCADCSLGGLARGAGLRESDVDGCLVVAKAFYMTRVGGGPFPTEFGGDVSGTACNSGLVNRETEKIEYLGVTVNNVDSMEKGIAIRQVGNEYGATTGRPRRTGRLDLALLRYTVGKCGNAAIALTKIDVLDDCDQIEICTHYVYSGPDYRLGDKTYTRGNVIETAILDETIFKYSEPVYKVFPGWKQETTFCTDAQLLPEKLKDIVRFVEREVGRVALLSVGPDREQTMVWPG